MNPLNKSIRRAFSLIEMLIVMLIIGILVAILVPAIQKVRASADNAGCANNLKQIGLAMGKYHVDFKHYPTTGIPSPGALQLWGNRYYYPSWPHDILPYIEQGALHRDSLNGIAIPDADSMFDKSVIGKVAATTVPTFLCPADRRPNAGLDPPPDPNHGYSTGFATTSYLGVIGKQQPAMLLSGELGGLDAYWHLKDDGVFPWPNHAASGGQPGTRRHRLARHGAAADRLRRPALA